MAARSQTNLIKLLGFSLERIERILILFCILAGHIELSDAVASKCIVGRYSATSNLFVERWRMVKVCWLALMRESKAWVVKQDPPAPRR